MRKIIATPKAPAAIGPYNQAIVVESLVFTSGQLPMDPATGELETDIEKATHQCFKNLAAILEEAGTSLDNAVKLTVFLDDMNNFAKVNGVYATYFEGEAPARSAFQVAKLPLGACIEIEAIATL